VRSTNWNPAHGPTRHPQENDGRRMGRDEEFSQYVSVRWAALVRSAVLLGCSRPDAEDLVQSALARCYVAWGKVHDADNRDAYVYRVLVNGLRDSRRRRWWAERPSEHLPEHGDDTDENARVDVADVVERALGGLSEAHRSVVVLRYFAHLSERETALALKIAPGTVKSRLSRALTELSKSEHLADTPNGSDG
jgi:RNA polymerase sigma-70 factor (sigma-E family)